MILTLFFVTTPTLFLLIYPLHFKILALLKISETKQITSLLKLAPLERFKPFFDSFQGSFKDKYRFFAGLYFVFRFTILLNLTLSEQLYLVAEMQLVVMLLLSSVCQPYKEKLHNIIDSLLFANLVIINALTTYNNYISHRVKLNSPIDSSYSRWLQIFLIYLPLVVFVVSLAIKLLNGYRNSRAQREDSQEEQFIPLEKRSPSPSPPLEDQQEFQSSADYNKI